jgi:hypothetical protein
MKKRSVRARAKKKTVRGRVKTELTASERQWVKHAPKKKNEKAASERRQKPTDSLARLREGGLGKWYAEGGVGQPGTDKRR